MFNIKYLSLLLVCFLILPVNAWAVNDDTVELCRKSIFETIDLTQYIANQVPNKIFGRFVRNGRRLPLALEAISLGGGDPKKGVRILFETAKPFFKQNQRKIVSTASSCQGKCDDIRLLKEKCDDVGDIAMLLVDLSVSRGIHIANLISSEGGLSGIKRSIDREVQSFNRDRK